MNAVWKGFSSSSMPLEFMLHFTSKNNDEATQLFLYIATPKSTTMNRSKVQLIRVPPCIPYRNLSSIYELWWSQDHVNASKHLGIQVIMMLKPATIWETPSTAKGTIEKESVEPIYTSSPSQETAACVHIRTPPTPSVTAPWAELHQILTASLRNIFPLHNLSSIQTCASKCDKMKELAINGCKY